MDPQDDEMSTDDVVRFLEVAAEFDVDAVKFTGGEPMLRQDLEEIIERTPDQMEVSLTTNGTFLPGRAEALVDAGLERVNVSQDALDPEDFAAVTKSGAYEKVLEGVEAALEAGLDPVKLNMVVFEHTAGYVPEMVDHVAENDGLQLQLIEYMPELTGKPGGTSTSSGFTTGWPSRPTKSNTGRCTIESATGSAATTGAAVAWSRSSTPSRTRRSVRTAIGFGSPTRAT